MNPSKSLASRIIFAIFMELLSHDTTTSEDATLCLVTRGLSCDIANRDSLRASNDLFVFGRIFRARADLLNIAALDQAQGTLL
jgi:hypothetical protein